jgi:hypothetical protein
MAHVGASWRFHLRLFGWPENVFANAWKCGAPIAHLDVCTLAIPGTQSDAQDGCCLQAPEPRLLSHDFMRVPNAAGGSFAKKLKLAAPAISHANCPVL